MPFQKLTHVSGNRSLTVAARMGVASIGAATVRERLLRSTMKTTSIALIFVLVAGAQQSVQTPVPAPQTTANGTVKFQANTQLVIETVTVKDKNGKPVEGLTAKDFTVTEDGVAQTISFCEFQKLDEMLAPAEPAAVPAAAPPAPAIAVPGVTAHQITPEKPGDIRYRDRRLMAMYFDMSAMPVPDQIRAEA